MLSSGTVEGGRRAGSWAPSGFISSVPIRRETEAMAEDAKAFITGVAGPEMSAEERAFVRDERPWGLILFRRNCREPAAVAALAAAFRDLVGRPDAPLLIDQEGGRVQRLAPPHWRRYPPARAFGALYAADREAGLSACFAGARLIAEDLAALGITIDCLPVLDVPEAGSHDVIGDRGYGETADLVAALGRAAADGLLAGGVLPVMKHAPGHGRSRADSHLALPVVDAPLEVLAAVDFAPFRALADLPFAMSAHVVYTALDPDRPATVSPRVIGEVIRGTIGFDGCLISDDVSMKALGDDVGASTRALFAAGCDIALHCNGDLAEMRAVAAAAPPLAGRSAERAGRGLAARRPPGRFDRDAALAAIDRLMPAGTLA